MNKLIIIIVIMQISMTVSAQRTVDALLLKKGSSDTLEVKIIHKNALFPKDSFNVLSLHKNIIIVGQERDIWIKEKDIDYISFIDFKGNHREFISIEAAPELKGIDSVNKKLYEIICDGKIKWYREYYLYRINYAVKASDYLIKENMEPVSIYPYTNFRKKLLELTEDMPELESDIKEIETYDDMLEIINIYNNN